MVGEWNQGAVGVVEVANDERENKVEDRQAILGRKQDVCRII